MVDAEGVEHARQFVCLGAVVVVAVEPRVGLTVALEVEGDAVEPVGERCHLMVPGEPCFGKAVQEDDDVGVGIVAARRGVLPQTGGLDEPVGHGGPGPERLHLTVVVAECLDHVIPSSIVIDVRSSTKSSRATGLTRERPLVFTHPAHPREAVAPLHRAVR